MPLAEVGEETRMINAAHDNLLDGTRHEPSAFQVWGSRLLVVVVVVWTVAMLVSLHQGFLDRFVATTRFGNIGVDFFCTPKGFRNLTRGNNVYLTEMDDFVDYCTPFLAHPMVAVVVGPWTATLPPMTAYGLFVAVSLVLLAISAGLIASQFESRLLRAFTLFALFCSPPTYLILWNGQAHVFLILAVSLMLTALIGIERQEGSSTRSLRMLQIGLLVSLLSKPVALLALPVLFATRETRRALVLPVAAYAALSVLFLLTPGLNAGGYNAAHWVNMLNASSSPKPTFSLVFPQEMDLVANSEIYCLPVYLERLTGAPLPRLWSKLPVLAILAMSVLPLLLASRRRRIDVLIATVMLCLLSHFLCYYMVWEYHYTTLLPMLPVLVWMSQREEHAVPRWLLRIALLVLLANFLPTFYFLAPQTPARYMTASTLLRVVPVVIAFVCLLLYGVGIAWAAWREGSAGLALPRGQLPELIKTGAALTLSGAAVLASVYATVPERLTRPLPQWDADDWSAHCEDLLSRPHPGLKPADLASMHYLLGSRYIDTDPRLGLEHYTAAIELVSDQPDRLFKLADRLRQSGQIDLAILAYRRVLQLAPHHPLAQARLRQLEKGSPSGTP